MLPLTVCKVLALTSDVNALVVANPKFVIFLTSASSIASKSSIMHFSFKITIVFDH